MWIEIYMLTRLSLEKWVTPFAGVWIEIKPAQPEAARHTVTPFAGVWIEIEWHTGGYEVSESLPSRECGLKWNWQDCAAQVRKRHSLRGSVD